jgi:hypothetical protein
VASTERPTTIRRTAVMLRAATDDATDRKTGDTDS